MRKEIRKLIMASRVRKFRPNWLTHKRFFFLGTFLLTAFISSCTFGQYSPQELEATARQIAGTSIVLTLMAKPTETLAPTEPATATMQPSATLSPSVLPSDTPTPTFLPTWTPYGQMSGTEFVENKTDKNDKNAPLLLYNKSGEEIHFVIFAPIYVEYFFTKSFTLIVAENTYQYRAWIGKSGPFTGSFAVTNGDKHILTFYSDHIHFGEP